MAYIFNSINLFTYIFILTILFTYVKPQTEEDLNVDDNKTEFNFKENKFLKVIPNFTGTYEFIKIQIEANNSNTDFALSYYKSKNNKRFQLSQSISGKAFIYLKKEQISKEFFIKIEFLESPSDYTLTFALKNVMELSLGEQYSYYVSEENKEINFNIIGKPEIKYTENEKENSSKLAIWAKGSLDLKAELNETNEKMVKKGISAYIVELKELKDFSYSFKVTGDLGDFITIGVLLFSNDNICQTPISDNKMEILGFLRKGLMEKISFLVSKSSNLELSYVRVTNHDLNISQVNPIKVDFDNENFIYTFSMDINTINEQIYLFEFKNSKNNNINLYPPLILGTTYKIYFLKGETIGLFPNNAGNSKYITYQTIQDKGTYKASILTCNNYPFCKDDQNSEKIPLLDYNSASISYSSSEYGKDLSSIHETQKVLLLECEDDDCSVYANIFTEKNNVTIFSENPIYRYIRKGNEDNFLINLQSFLTGIWNINLEKISGDFKINFDSKKVKEIAKTENKFLYEVNNTNEVIFPIKIKANENTVYSIIITKKSSDLKSQINYLLNNEIQNIIFNDELYSYLSHLYYLGFYKIKCNLEVLQINSLNESDKISLKKKNNYYQDFKGALDITKNYNITVKDKNSNDCTYILSLFRYKDKKNKTKSIVLPFNTPYYFFFNSTLNEAKYMYIHSDKNKKIQIDLKSVKSNYKIELFLNDISISIIDTEINSEKSIKNLYKHMKELNDNQPIKINLVLTPKKPEENPEIEIKITDLSEFNSKLFLIIGITIITFLLVIIIVVIIFLCKSKSKYDELAARVNAVSFENNNMGQRDSKEDDLLE